MHYEKNRKGVTVTVRAICCVLKYKKSVYIIYVLTHINLSEILYISVISENISNLRGTL